MTDVERERAAAAAAAADDFFAAFCGGTDKGEPFFPRAAAATPSFIVLLFAVPEGLARALGAAGAFLAFGAGWGASLEGISDRHDVTEAKTEDRPSSSPVRPSLRLSASVRARSRHPYRTRG